MPLYRANNIVRGLPSNTTNRKLMATTVLHQCDGCQPCSALLAPLFFQPRTHQCHQAGSQSGALRRLGSPHAPRCFQFPFMCTSTFSTKKGSQEAMWELNTRLGYNKNERIQKRRFALGSVELLWKGPWALLQWKLKWIIGSLQRKRIKLCIYLWGNDINTDLDRCVIQFMHPY